MATNDQADIITIRSVEETQTKSGANAGSTYLIVTDTTERKLFAFDAKTFPALRARGTVEIETQWSKDGKSERITSAKPANGAAPAPYVPPSTTMDRETSIRRQVALKCATDLQVALIAKGVDNDPNVSAVVILASARQFADWLDNADDEGPF